jgi:3-oxoadipate enol-lactonase
MRKAHVVMPQIIVNDLEMHFIHQGQGQEIVLLMHGNASSSVWWEYTFERIRPDYRFIAPDLRGRGDTSGPDTDWTIEQLAADVYGLIRSLGITESVHLVGHSLGGNVSLQYALDHPREVKSLTLLNPIWVAGDMPPELGSPERIRAMLADDRQVLKTVLRGVAAMHPEDDNWRRLEAASLKQTDAATWRLPAALNEWSVVDRLPLLGHIPALVVRGTGDTYLSTPQVCQTIVDRIPGVRFVEIDGATHSPNVETPDSWMEILYEHLERAR